MGGAVGINLIFFPLILKRKPFMANRFSLSEKTKIDQNLIIGSMMFGIGWGISGICPGPAIVNLVSFKFEVVIFVVSMLLGMVLYNKKGTDLP